MIFAFGISNLFLIDTVQFFPGNHFIGPGLFAFTRNRQVLGAGNTDRNDLVRVQLVEPVETL